MSHLSPFNYLVNIQAQQKPDVSCDCDCDCDYNQSHRYGKNNMDHINGLNWI